MHEEDEEEEAFARQEQEACTTHGASRCTVSVKVEVSEPLLVEEVVIHRLREQGD